MIEINAFMQPVDSPVASRDGSVDAYSFDSNNERGAVSGVFIKDASIGNAKIGTAAIQTANIADAAVTNAKITSIEAGKIAAGTVSVGINLGTSSSGSVILDGANNRIIVHDGTTNRIVIGNV